MTKNCTLLSGTMDNDKEVATLVNFFPKRENLRGEIKENIEGDDGLAKSIMTVCPTSWTVRASCFQIIIDSYTALLQE